jgi:hypothetical protein
MGHHDIQITKNVYAKDVPILGHQAIKQMTELALPNSPSTPIENLPKPSKPKPPSKQRFTKS